MKTKNFLKVIFTLVFLHTSANIFAAKPEAAPASSLPDAHIDYPGNSIMLFYDNKVDEAIKLIDSVKNIYAKKVSPASILIMEAATYFEAAKIPTYTPENKTKVEQKKSETLSKISNITNSELAASFMFANGLITTLRSNSDTINYIQSNLQYKSVSEIEARFDTARPDEKHLVEYTKNNHAFLLINLARAQYNSGNPELKKEACKNARVASELFIHDFLRRDAKAVAEFYCPKPEPKPDAQPEAQPAESKPEGEQQEQAPAQD